MILPYRSRSLTAKLTYLMTLVVLVTVASLTIQSANKFSAYILQNIEETSTSMAERAAADISASIENWIGQISVVTTKLSGSKVDANNNDTDLAAVLRADSDLLALNLYTVDGQSTRMIRQARQDSLIVRGEGIRPEKDLVDRCVDVMGSFANSAAINPKLFDEDIVVQNITSKTKTPTMLLAVKFSIPNHPNKYAIMVAAARTTKLQVALPQSRYTTSYILAKDGSMFASTDEVQMSNPKPISGNQLVTKALRRQTLSGFLPEFQDRSGKKKIGSFSQIPGKIPLYVLVERDRKAAFRIITRTYMSSALWGLLILFLAMMICFLTAGTVTKNLRDLVGATKKIASGEFGYRLQPYSRDEVAELGHSVNHMAARIQLLMKSEIEKVRFENELETARMVQSTFFPKKDISRSHLTVTGNYQPATECGGDLWGHFTIKDGVELLFIADAMGHGVPAALVTAVAYAVCQSVATVVRENSNVDSSPAALLNRLNNVILDAVDGRISMTFFAAVFDFNTGKLTFANAGHNFPFIITENKEDARLGKIAKRSSNNNLPTTAITLSLQGTPLGVERDLTFNEKTLDLEPGDKIFFFTDGLIENTLNSAQPLGRKGLIDAVCASGNLDITQIKDKVLETGRRIYGSDNLQDDVTVVVAEVSKSWKRLTAAPSGISIENSKSLIANGPQAVIESSAIPVFEISESVPEMSAEPVAQVRVATFDLSDGTGNGSGEVENSPDSEPRKTKIPLPAV